MSIALLTLAATTSTALALLVNYAYTRVMKEIDVSHGDAPGDQGNDSADDIDCNQDLLIETTSSENVD